MKETYIRCECCAEGLHLARFEDDDSTYVSLYAFRPYGEKPMWRERLRHIWHIVRNGHPWVGEISLDAAGARKAALFLLDSGSTTTTFTMSRVGTAQDFTVPFNGG